MTAVVKALDDGTPAALLKRTGMTLSVVPHAVPAVKEAVRATSLDRAAALARRALDVEDADAVRRLLAR
jgi:phosphoenolpyruvate-protein kinase (PTS system EI component)